MGEKFMKKRSMKKIILIAFAILLIGFCLLSVFNIGNNNNGDGTMNNVTNGSTAEAIDLGLSVKWASHNLGATKPEEYGGLYGWGDPTGQKTSTSNNDYPNGNPPSDIRGMEYDMAHVQWGGSWRLPSRAEQEELLNNCTWTATSVNGIQGYRVTGPNGNSIFLPASGGRIGTEIHYRVEGGDYWSGTLSSNIDEACYMWFYGGRQAVEDLPRHYGFAVRPVSD